MMTTTLTILRENGDDDWNDGHACKSQEMVTEKDFCLFLEKGNEIDSS